ncbi:MAG: ribbon-helix-helix domain-containing protein [Ignisphaera sp.]
MRYRNAEIELDIMATKVVSVKIDIETLSEIEDLCRKHHYKSRSDFIRDAIKLYISILKQVDDKNKLEKLLQNSKNGIA